MAEAAPLTVPKIQSFAEFFPFYLGEHAHPLNRRLHFIGSNGVLALLAAAIVTGNPWLLAATPVMGYGFAWVGHFFVEKNKPASFKYPLWSFMGDWKMYYLILTGKL